MEMLRKDVKSDNFKNHNTKKIASEKTFWNVAIMIGSYNKKRGLKLFQSPF